MTNDVLRITRDGAIALIEIDNPPVNAAGHAVRQALWDRVPELDADPSVQVIAIYGAGRTFTAGADIREFGKPTIPPSLPDLCQRLEACKTPLVCALHGTALGGGLEIAVATHARVGLPGLRVGLPEVALGIIPGAGGTQRAPRLAGLEPGLEMITSGRHIPADEALSLHLIDRIDTDADSPRAAALNAAQDVLAGTLPHRRTGDIPLAIDPDVIAAWDAKMRSKHPHLPNRAAAVQAVAACALPIADGMKEERRIFQICHDSPERAGLVHAFFAERATARIPEAKATPRAVTTVGVIGGGTMGSGIATALLLAGLPVILSETSTEALGLPANGSLTIWTGPSAGANDRECARRRLSERLVLETDLNAHVDADLVIEAAFEDLSVKQTIFANWIRSC